MTKEIAVSNTQAVVGSFTQKELDTIKSTIAKGTTNEQFALFVQTCVASGLNPFLNQIFCTVYNGQGGPQMTIQIAVEGIVMLAKKNPLYKGFIAAEVKKEDEFSADYAKGEVEHKITTMQRGQTVGAYCVAYREGAPNILVIITSDQVDHFKASSIGAQQKMWKTYYDDMIVKYAIKRAFKRQFGIEISEDEHSEPNSFENIPAYDPQQRRDVTDEVEQAQQQAAAAQQPEQEAPKEPTNTEILGGLLKQLGKTTKDVRDAYIAEKLGGEKLNTKNIIGLIKILQAEVEQQDMPEDLT